MTLATYIKLSLAFILGVIVSLVVSSWSLLKFDATFTLGNIILACSTIFTGFVVAYYVQSLVQGDRKEKDFILDQLTSILVELDRFEEFTDGGSLYEINPVLKRINIAGTSVRQVVEELNCTDEIKTKVDFQAIHTKMKKQATNTPASHVVKEVEDNNDLAAEVKQSFITLSKESSALLSTLIQDYRSQVFKARIAVNRM